MKYFLTLVLMLISLSACATGSGSTASSNKKTPTFHTGDITKAELKADPKFFKHHHSDISEDDVKRIKNINQPIEIISYFGLWCHDSQREIPQLLDLLEAAQNQLITHKLIALDISKKEPLGRQQVDNVLYTPTIIIKVEGKEAGRIIEKPKKTLSEDISDIFHQYYKDKTAEILTSTKIINYLPITSHPGN